MRCALCSVLCAVTKNIFFIFPDLIFNSLLSIFVLSEGGGEVEKWEFQD